ncbi:hypothetical protein H5410_049271 [Solanum commersonii]|uniref:Uncharacterized protein n=1 Tax=Solanum commersonii TaxID=4109 RepID=A0A9J5XLV3_SOLCO|nr:hypothetical protein H5410_049271 [Solanum commersonii]
MKNLKNEKSHVLIALFPGQGQINPRLQFSKQLINLGIGVTLTTSLSAFSKIKNLPNVEGLSFSPFSDGYDGKFQSSSIDEFHLFYSTIHNYSDYFKNYVAKDIIIELSGFPPFSPIDFPSFVFDDVESSNWAVKSIKRQIEMLSSEKNPRVLVNTFNALKVLKHVTMMGIGHSIPSIFLDDNTFRADMIEISSKNYMDWLNSTDKGLVIYIAFDSYSEISSQLMEKIAHELLKYGRPFLWVIREGKNGYKMEDKLSCKDELEKRGKIGSGKAKGITALRSSLELRLSQMVDHSKTLRSSLVIREGQDGDKMEETLSCKDELETQGKIVSWFSQVEVLKHPSVGFFLTQCG